MLIFELTLKRKCVKWCKQFKYYHEMHLKRQITSQNLVKNTKFTHCQRWMTKLVKIFEERLITNFTQTWGTKNIFNPLIYDFKSITIYMSTFQSTNFTL